jgi:type VI secretion system FHA domain protein
MRLRLTVTSDHRRELADRASHEFSEAGGIVGRSAAADWSLPDETKTLSSRHLSVTFADGTFRITDTSTNGVYLNTVDVPLGRGATMPLRSGDTLYFGPYVVGVEVIADAIDGRQRLGLGASWKAVRGDEVPVAAPRIPAGFDDLLPPGAGPDADDLLAPGAAAALTPRARLLARRQEVDPIAGLDSRPPDDPLVDGIGRRDDDLLAPLPLVPLPPAPLPLGPAPAPLPRRAPPPAAASGPRPPLAAIIPPNFDPLSGDLAPVGPSAPPDLRPLPFPEPPPLPPMPAPPLAPVLPPASPLPRPASATPPAPRNEHAPPTDVMALLRLRALAAGDDAPPAAHADAAGGSLLAAIGVDPAALSPDAADRAAAALAAFIVEAAEGLVDMLETRRTLKDELHLDHTRLGATDNNPFKFFASGREALRQMLVKEPPGFLTLADGAGEAFADVREHELATMTAIQAAAATLLGRLSPAAIEAQAEAGGFLGRVDKARLWDRYVDLHGRALETLDVSVGELVAEHYARALSQRPAARRKESEA